MNVIRYRTLDPGWTALDSLFNLRNELSRVLASTWGESARGTEFFNDGAPAVDVLEDKNNLYVVAELPGMKKEDIAISLQEGVLSITGERKATERGGEQLHRSEIVVGRFHRTLTLPKPVAADKVKAAYRDGVLTVTLPKPEEAQPRQIQVVAA